MNSKFCLLFLRNQSDDFMKALQLMERESTCAFEIGKGSESLKVKLVNWSTVKFLSAKARVEMSFSEEKNWGKFALQLYECCVGTYDGTPVSEYKLNYVAFCPQANYTERPPLIGEVSANFCG
jgi:hypothetical protein